jgi:hypothetical protein
MICSSSGSEFFTLYDLVSVMRSIYEDTSEQPTKIVKQVKRLNDLTIKQIIPGMLSNLEQYYGYLNQINKPINPIDLPINVNQAGRRSAGNYWTVTGIDGKPRRASSLYQPVDYPV